MCKKVLLGLILSTLLTCGAYAQSSSRGSASKGSSSSRSSSAMKTKERVMEKEISRVAKEIRKENFAGIKLDRSQRGALSSLISLNLEKMTSLDTQVARMIPAKDAKKLQRSYLVAKKEGLDEMEAMKKSMEAISLDEAKQESVLTLSKQKMEIVSTIVAGMDEHLNDEQKAVLAEAKQAMMADEKEAMTDKEDVMPGKDEANVESAS